MPNSCMAIHALTISMTMIGLVAAFVIFISHL
jgi:hypothetical protein